MESNAIRESIATWPMVTDIELERGPKLRLAPLRATTRASSVVVIRGLKNAAGEYLGVAYPQCGQMRAGLSASKGVVEQPVAKSEVRCREAVCGRLMFDAVSVARRFRGWASA